MIYRKSCLFMFIFLQAPPLDRASGISFAYSLIRDFTYHFSWKVDEDAYGDITGFVIVKEFKNKACPLHSGYYKGITHFHYSTHIRDTDIKLKPYTEYIFTLRVEETTQNENSMSLGPSSTDIDENITPEETPVFESAEADLTSINIFFHYVNCTKVGGPLYLNYEASGVEERCNKIPQKKRGMKYPFEVNRIIISGLLPYCTYNVTIYVSRTDNNWENAKSLKPFQRKTRSIVITDPVEELLVISKGKNHVHLRWKNASTPNGDINKFCVVTSKGEYFAAIGKDVNACKLWQEYWCHDVNMKYVFNKENNILIIGINRNNLSKPELTEQIKYAKNSRQYAETTVTPIESQPERPYGARYEWIKNNLLRVFWKHPNCTNGILRRFIISFYMSYDGNSDNNIFAQYSLNRGRDDYKLEYQLQETISSQRKIQSLNVSITAINDFGSSPVRLVVPTSPPDPTPYDPDRIKMDGVVLKLLKPSIDAFFEKMFIFKTDIDEEVTEDDYQNKLREIKKLLERGIEPTKTYFMINLIYTYLREENQDIVIKEGSGLFQKNAKYKIAVFTVNSLNGKRIVRITQKTGTTQKAEISTHNDNPGPTAHPAIYIFLAFLLVLPFMGYLLYRYRHKINLRAPSFISTFQRYENSPRTDISSNIYENVGCSEIMGNMADTICPGNPLFRIENSRRVKLEHFRKYVKGAIESNELNIQYQLFPRGPPKSSTYGLLPQNKTKNRNNNLIAYDDYRVILNKIERDEHSDYINASYIDGYRNPRAYIATQGPKKNTLHDFWRMVWQKEITQIVILAKVYEGGKKKLEQYWPNKDESLTVGDFTIKLNRSKVFANYEYRTLLVLYKKKNPREICQLHFTAWPDDGVLLYPQSLVPVLEQMLTFRSCDFPILVHCSAGVGRTGTVILCDISLRMAAAEGYVDILAMLEHLTNQKANMIDNVEQYKLAHLVILNSLMGLKTSIPIDRHFATTVDALLQNDEITTQLQFIKDCEWEDEAMKSVAFLDDDELVPEKNRCPGIIPDDVARVYLPPFPLSNPNPSSTYINAVRVDGLCEPGRFIVTQFPLPNTIGDFWRLVVEKEISVIICLNDIPNNDDSCRLFFPVRFEEFSPQETIKVKHVKSKTFQVYTILTFEMTVSHPYLECKTSTTLDIIKFRGWKSSDLIPDYGDFLAFVEDSTNVAKKSFPTLITCYDGATASGLYIAMSLVIEKIKLEYACDVCQAIRCIRTSRRQFASSKEQLTFLYKASRLYVDDKFGHYSN